MSSLKYKTNNGYEPLPAMVVRKTNAENGNGIGTCSTSSGTALAVSLTNYELVQNGFVAVTFEHDVPANATLNVNGKGAKAIIYKGSAIDGDTIKADDTVMFGYDGTNYVLISSGGSGSVNLVEYLTVSLTSNQTNPNSDLIGATVVITDTESSETLFSTTWQGTDLEFEIPTGTVYQVTVGAVSGYTTPAAVTHTAGLNKSRTDTFTYDTEVVTVTCTTEDNVAVTGHKVTINNVEYTLDSTGIVSAKVAYGTTYTVSLGSWDEYTTPATQSFTASQASRSVSMEWQTLYVDLGLPSGTKWAKRNIDVRQPNGFTVSTYQYDCSYFSWGNVDGHHNGESYNFSNSYNSSPGSSLTGNIPVSSTYDAARAHCGSPWRMPTIEEWKELGNNTVFLQEDGVTEIDSSTSLKIINYNGVNGVLLRSKINGKKLFIPCAGYWDTVLTSITDKITMHGSTLKSSTISSGIDIYIDPAVATFDSYSGRGRGKSIRPVQ